MKKNYTYEYAYLPDGKTKKEGFNRFEWAGKQIFMIEYYVPETEEERLQIINSIENDQVN